MRHHSFRAKSFDLSALRSLTSAEDAVQCAYVTRTMVSDCSCRCVRGLYRSRCGSLNIVTASRKRQSVPADRVQGTLYTVPEVFCGGLRYIAYAVYVDDGHLSRASRKNFVQVIALGIAGRCS